MAITGTAIDNGSASSVSSKNTNSITQNSARYYVVLVMTEGSTMSTKNHPTITGFTEVKYIGNSADRDNFTVTALGRVGSGSAGAVTIDYAGQSQSFLSYQVIEFDGIDTTGTVVQSASNQQSTGANTVTLSGALGSASNAVVFFSGAYSFTTIGTPTGYTLISNATGDLVLHSSFKINGGLTVTASNNPADDSASIGLEIKAASAAGLLSPIVQAVPGLVGTVSVHPPRD